MKDGCIPWKKERTKKEVGRESECAQGKIQRSRVEMQHDEGRMMIYRARKSNSEKSPSMHTGRRRRSEHWTHQDCRQDHEGRPGPSSIFSLIMASFSVSGCGDRDREGKRTLDRHSLTQVHREARSSLSLGAAAGDSHALRWLRPRMGASERKERKTSLRMISGEARMDDIVCGVCDGEDATVWRISPIWTVQTLLLAIVSSARAGARKTYLTGDGIPRQGADEGPQHYVSERDAANAAGDVDT